MPLKFVHTYVRKDVKHASNFGFSYLTINLDIGSCINKDLVRSNCRRTDWSR
jgi:hypothetical protein